ncbi:MAG TPA: PIG-L family deacetylase [Pseudomonadales bacterium]|nr:PIG-L family deacetylase [Pseudomonadales bacterium]
MINPYQKFVSAIAEAATRGHSLPLGGIIKPKHKTPDANAPVVMLVSPHPDDECITGGLPLRLMRESGMRIVNVAVTLGSNENRRTARLTELKNACEWIGFELEETGLERILPATRQFDAQTWSSAIKTIAALITKHKPRAIVFPHERDWHPTHIGTHLLVMDALRRLPLDFKTILIETEFWGQLLTPNLMVELSPHDVADLLAALSHHTGEMKRNPYHLRLPSWLQDNVRRGSELVGGKGATAPDFVFATLYWIKKWQNGGVKEMFRGGTQISMKDSPGSILD